MPISGNKRPGPRDTGPSIEDSLRDAEHRTLDFPAAERAIYIRAMVTRAQELKASGRSIDQIKEQLPEFSRDYSHLFDTVTRSEEYDASTLNTMLAMLDRMGQGGLNHHQATVIVGQRLAQKHIRPDGSASS